MSWAMVNGGAVAMPPHGIYRRVRDGRQVYLCEVRSPLDGTLEDYAIVRRTESLDAYQRAYRMKLGTFLAEYVWERDA